MDWVTWERDNIRMRPRGRDSRRVLANLIYSGTSCMDVFVDGFGIRRDGVTKTVDESAASRELEDAAQEYYSEL